MNIWSKKKKKKKGFRSERDALLVSHKTFTILQPLLFIGYSYDLQSPRQNPYLLCTYVLPPPGYLGIAGPRCPHPPLRQTEGTSRCDLH